MEQDTRVPWVQKSRDFMDKVYWSLKYVGLAKAGEDAAGNNLYKRIRKGPEQWGYLLGQEDFLNQSFDIAFAIAPDALIEAALLAPLGLADTGPFTSVGREVSRRQNWPRNANLMQQDGFFVSARTALALEMKTGSATSRGQTLKYLCLLAMEERASGRKGNLGLLYLVGKAAVAKTQVEAGVSAAGRIVEGLDGLGWARLNKGLRIFVDEHRAEVEDVRQRTQVAVLSWSGFDERLEQAANLLAGPDAGGQTLRRLIEGLRAQIRWQTGEGTLDVPRPDL